jgi:alkylhydroperoxidase family enzyme
MRSHLNPEFKEVNLMALLKLVPPENADGKLAELYSIAEEMFGAVPNNVRMLGVSPAVLEDQLEFVRYFRAHPTLSVPFLAMVRLVVAASTDSPYCEKLNTGMLARLGVPANQAEAFKDDPRSAPLNDKEKALLTFVLRATRDPHNITAEDVQKLRELGWSDADIFDAVAHGARAVATNIIFDTFKLETDAF